MESVLIMGGSDFIGKSLAKYFIKHRHKVDVLTTGHIDYDGVNKHLSCNRKNLDELENALKDNEYTYIYDMTAFLKSEIQDNCFSGNTIPHLPVHPPEVQLPGTLQASEADKNADSHSRMSQMD